MKKNNNLKVILFTFGALAVVALGYWYNDQQKPGQYDEFAQCLSTKGVKFYGAFWCPHCQAQKALFGKSKQFLPYVECSNADQKSQTQICIDKKIESYPTWSFQISTGTPATTTEVFVSGEKTFEELSTQSGCALPILK